MSRYAPGMYATRRAPPGDDAQPGHASPARGRRTAVLRSSAQSHRTVTSSGVSRRMKIRLNPASCSRGSAMVTNAWLPRTPRARLRRVVDGPARERPQR